MRNAACPRAGGLRAFCTKPLRGIAGKRTITIMMQKIETRKKISLGIRIVVTAVCYFLAVRWNTDVQEAARIVMVSLTGGATAETAELICGEEQKEEGEAGTAGGQEEMLSLCFWREQEDLQFSCRETGKTAWATGLLTEGDTELAVRGSGILAWQEKGCVMDDVTAQELFGTQQANGQLVWCSGEAYIVYGTFESLERTVVLRTGSGSAKAPDLSAGGTGIASKGNLFDHVSMRVPAGRNAKTAAEQVLMRCGLEGDIMDFTFPGIVCGNLLLVLPALLAAGLVRLLWRYHGERSPEKKKITAGQRAKYRRALEKSDGFTGRIVCAVMALASAAAFCFLLREHLQIPADMIPTRWSDFSFWPQWWAGQRTNLLQILRSAQGEMQLEVLWSFGLSVAWNFLAIAAGAPLLSVL